MEAFIVVLGVFLLIAITKNKELSGDDRTQQNKEIHTHITIFIFFMIFGGLGFLLPAASATFPNYSFLFPVFAFVAAVPIFAKGKAKVISTIAWASVFIFLIMGSYM
jgi:cytochrome b561